jgi:hypothetical protein
LVGGVSNAQATGAELGLIFPKIVFAGGIAESSKPIDATFALGVLEELRSLCLKP